MKNNIKDTMNPTKTTNRIHFSDLSPERFEDMCLHLIYRYKDWLYISHPGRLGDDGAIDIKAVCFENEVKTTWVFQCKRYQKIAYSQLKIAIDDLIKKNNEIPDYYVFMLGCDISRKNEEKIIEYAKSNGFKNILIWNTSYMEALLYAKCPDILFIFFGIDMLHKRSINVANIKRRLSLKKKVESVIVPYYANEELRRDIVIHDVNNDIYPNIQEIPGISPWFKLGYFKLYFRGISFFLGPVKIRVNLITAKWSIEESNDCLPEGSVHVMAQRIGNIPYDNIVDFEMTGDEYYPFPHFYCEFNNLGEPYEEIWYLPVNKDVVMRLNNDFTVELK